MRDTSSRKLFLAGASLTALTACSGANAAISAPP